MSLPASTTGAHAKKQGEDLSDNDGDEDEGIFHGEQRWCMSFFLFYFFNITVFWSSMFFVSICKFNHQALLFTLEQSLIKEVSSL